MGSNRNNKPKKVEVDLKDKHKHEKLLIEVDVEVDVKDKGKDDCKCKDDCLCKALEKFVGEEVLIKTKSGDFIEGKLKEVKDCCVKVIEPEMSTPMMHERITFVRCKDIESFSVELIKDK